MAAAAAAALACTRTGPADAHMTLGQRYCKLQSSSTSCLTSSAGASGAAWSSISSSVTATRPSAAQVDRTSLLGRPPAMGELVRGQQRSLRCSWCRPAACLQCAPHGVDAAIVRCAFPMCAICSWCRVSTFFAGRCRLLFLRALARLSAFLSRAKTRDPNARIAQRPRDRAEVNCSAVHCPAAQLVVAPSTKRQRRRIADAAPTRRACIVAEDRLHTLHVFTCRSSCLWTLHACALATRRACARTASKARRRRPTPQTGPASPPALERGVCRFQNHHPTRSLSLLWWAARSWHTWCCSGRTSRSANASLSVGVTWRFPTLEGEDTPTRWQSKIGHSNIVFVSSLAPVVSLSLPPVFGVALREAGISQH